MPLLMGLFAALGWGVADYLGGLATHSIGVRRTAFFGQLVGWIVVSLVMLIMPPLWGRAAGASWAAWGYGLLAGSCNLAGSIALLRAFSLGRAALVAPLVTSYAAVTAILGLLSGETLGGFRLLGVGICLLGAPFAAAASNPGQVSSSHRSGASFAIGAAACFGIGFWVQGAFAVPMLGVAPTLWLFFGLGIVVLGPMLALGGEGVWPPREALPLLLAQSLCSLVAYGSFAAGMATGAVIVVTVLSTLAAGVTALLGLILKRERLTRPQWLGVAAVMCGVILLRIGM